MENFKKLIFWILQSLLLSFGFTILIFFIGIFIGGNFGFPAISGAEPGYESAGLVFGRIGVLGGIGMFVYLLIGGKKRKGLKSSKK